MPAPPLALPALTLPALEADLSAERLATFREPGDDDATVLARYAWNQAVVDAFGFPLHLLEVSLRNTVDGAGRHATGPVRAHGGVPSWLDARPAVLDGPPPRPRPAPARRCAREGQRSRPAD